MFDLAEEGLRVGATIILSGERLWSAGRHAFWPIMDRIRAAATQECRPLVEPLYGEEAEAFQMIVLDDSVSAEAFRCFAWAARSEFERCAQSEEAAGLPDGYYRGIMDCWADLVGLLEADGRWEVRPPTGRADSLPEAVPVANKASLGGQPPPPPAANE